MQPRKTFPVARLLGMANHYMASEGSTPEGREAVASLLSAVLLDTDNYKGFGYCRSEYLPADQQSAKQVLRDGYDPTRRQYFGQAVTS